ncbi:MAG TPA: outer membrane lipoprotein carrier protein LolA, partial [Acidobacteriota bacterium]|nr:outer membrane lipoprotein carrier protein LolA [Acidobacteriota bacterium]
MILLLVFLLFISTAHGDAALNNLMEKLQNKYQNLGTLKANFTQSYASKRFSDRIVEEGVVYLRKGGYMKWEYQKPERKIFISDGRYFIYYVPEDKQAIKASLDRSDVHSPALFLAGRGNFLTDFRAEWADPRPGSNLVKLIPIRPQLDFQYLNAQVDPASGLILRLVVVDSYENRTEYSFQQIKENLS